MAPPSQELTLAHPQKDDDLSYGRHLASQAEPADIDNGKASYSSRSPGSFSSNNEVPEDFITEYLGSSPLLSSFSMTPSTEERGTSIFVTNFVSAQSWPSQGHFHFLTDICRTSGHDAWLSHAMTAVGLGWQANASKSPQIMIQARKEYAAALRATNHALRSGDATKDSTLLAIMVLSIFENVTGKKEISMKAWTEHLNGAAELLKLRGTAQLKTAVGYNMFLQISSHYLITCMQREVPLPEEIRWLRAEATKQLDGLMPVSGLFTALDQFTAFRGKVKDGDLTDAEEILREGVRIDGLLAEVFTKAPREWTYETVYTNEDPEVIYNGRYDIYYDYWVAQVWNGVRACRLLLNERLRAKLLQGFASVPPLFVSEEYTALFQMTTRTILRMRDEILYTVPQHVGYVTRKPFTRPSGTVSPVTAQDGSSSTDSPSPPAAESSMQTSIFNWKRRGPPPVAASGYFLMWPLFVSGLTRLSSQEMRNVTTDRLLYVAEVMGIHQAYALADYLDSMLVNIDLTKPWFPSKRPHFGNFE